MKPISRQPTSICQACLLPKRPWTLCTRRLSNSAHPATGLCCREHCRQAYPPQPMALPPSVKVKSTVGAGDAMVSGLVAGHVQGWSLPECARFATACSLGAITNVGHNLPASETLQAYVQQVTIHTATHVPRSA